MIKGKYKRRDTCRFCGYNQFVEILDLGWQPLAGTFLKKEEIGKEKFYPLKLYQCLYCNLVQLRDIVPREELFQSFLSSVSMQPHFDELADILFKGFLTKGSFVVEIGSNDGVLLDPLQQMGAEVLGVEPVKHIADLATARGVKTINKFFDSEVAKQIGKKADMVVATNVLAHIDDMGDVMAGVNLLLKDKGLLVFEVHYLKDLVDKTQYDTIYHEHLSYYDLNSLTPFLTKHGLEVITVQSIPTHSGSIRVIAQKLGGDYIQAPPIREPKKDWNAFINKVNRSKIDLVSLLKKLVGDGKVIYGYGAAGRANTLLNFCGITTDLVKKIFDESPLRYGYYTPGTHIPVVYPDKDLPDYFIIFAWNYEKEIRNKLKDYKGKFIIPLPEVRVV